MRSRSLLGAGCVPAVLFFFPTGGRAQQAPTPAVPPAAGQPVATAPSAQSTPLTVLPGTHKGPWFNEQTMESWIEPGVRLILNAPEKLDPTHPIRLIFFATPNGNTAEQTLGSALAPGIDWHFDIQHIAAQTRRLREINPGENIILACVQPDTLSWPAWRRQTPFNEIKIADLVEAVRQQVQMARIFPIRLTLAAHSGGGSFLFGFLNSEAAISDNVDRIAFLDANYSYSDDDKHGDKLLTWLKGDPKRHLVVIAYDDRNIELNGKKVVGADGGTYRASGRMLTRFKKDLTFTEETKGDFVTSTSADGQIVFHVNTNPQNKILHTALVGDMNGFLEAMTFGTPQATTWGTFGGPRAYTQWVQPAAVIPPRPADAIGGAAFMAKIADLSKPDREEAIATEICRGNIPDFLRKFKTITVTSDIAGKSHTATYEVAPDYLAVGSDTDFVRIPMTPMTAQRIADAFGCSLPTRKMVDDIYKQAEVKLEPHPMTVAREAVATFVEYNTIIEGQRAGHPLGLLVAGDKKDIVVTNRLREQPHRVAIYGWHKLDGIRIQPLVIVHGDTYVDYSHGVRLVKRTVTVDGHPRDLHMALHSSDLWPLFSDEGVVSVPSY